MEPFAVDLPLEIHEGMRPPQQVGHRGGGAPAEPSEVRRHPLGVANLGGPAVEGDGGHVEGQFPALAIENGAAPGAQRDLALVLLAGLHAVGPVVDGLHLNEPQADERPEEGPRQENPPQALHAALQGQAVPLVEVAIGHRAAVTNRSTVAAGSG